MWFTRFFIIAKNFKKKNSKKIYLYEKSKRNISKIKKLKLPGVLVKKPEDAVSKSEFIIFCTPMSEYKKIILRINKFLTTKHIITDVGSSKLRSSEIIKKNLKKMLIGYQAILLLDLKSVDLSMVKKIFLKINGVF